MLVAHAGAWSNLREGDDINTASRSLNAALLATGDNRGNVSLYRYPCTAERVSVYIVSYSMPSNFIIRMLYKNIY